MSYIQKFPVNGKRYIPTAQVSFHTEKECYQIKGEALDKVQPLDPTNQLLSVMTSKTLANPAGTFNLQLVGDEWLNRLKSNDVVVIRMGYKDKIKNTHKQDTVMVGLIDRVRRTRNMGSGEPIVQTTVMGRDFGKVLIKALLKFYPEIGMTSEASDENKFFLTEDGWLTLSEYFTGKDAQKGSPAVLLDIVMRKILPKLYAVDWTVYDESKQEPSKKSVGIGNILRYNFAQTNFFSLPLFMTLDSYEGSLWNLMERASIKPFTELFVDTRSGEEAWNATGKNRVVPETLEKASNQKDTPPVVEFGDDGAKVVLALRNTPFDRGSWDKLFQHDLLAEDVISEDLEISDEEHVNLFWAGQQINPLGIDLKREAPPLLNEANAKRYGLSPMEVEIGGFAFDPEKSSEEGVALQDFSQHYSKRLKAWFENNHTYMNGSMEVRGKGSYRVGQRLLRTGITREFYIEGVTQSFHVFASWTTNLSLTRGIKPGTQPVESDYLIDKKQKPASEQTDAEIGKRYYTVKSGDTLWKIAAMKDHYGSGSQWTKIWEANKTALIDRDSRNKTNPGAFIYPNMVLQIP
jgi:hypothetical protein